MTGLVLLTTLFLTPAVRGFSPESAPALRVCADPNNLPFSNDKEEGFENAIARLVARDLNQRLEYVWWPQRRGFVRHTLNGGACDVILGVPAGFEPVLTTRPYYRSTYVFVSRARQKLNLRSLDDPRLKRLRIGVQMIGDDFANSPPAHALSSRGIVRNVAGYSVALWTGALAGPIVWLTLLETHYVLSYVACEMQQTWFLHLATVVSVALVGGAGLWAWRAGYRPRGLEEPLTPPVDQETCDGRARWMAIYAAAASAWFILVILAMEVPVLVLRTCQ